MISRDDLAKVIDSCRELPEAVKKELKALTPAQYVGNAEHLVDLYWESK